MMQNSSAGRTTQIIFINSALVSFIWAKFMNQYGHATDRRRIDAPSNVYHPCCSGILVLSARLLVTTDSRESSRDGDTVCGIRSIPCLYVQLTLSPMQSAIDRVSKRLCKAMDRRLERKELEQDWRGLIVWVWRISKRSRTWRQPWKPLPECVEPR